VRIKKPLQGDLRMTIILLIYPLPPPAGPSLPKICIEFSIVFMGEGRRERICYSFKPLKVSLLYGTVL